MFDDLPLTFPEVVGSPVGALDSDGVNAMPYILSIGVDDEGHQVVVSECDGNAIDDEVVCAGTIRDDDSDDVRVSERIMSRDEEFEPVPLLAVGVGVDDERTLTVVAFHGQTHRASESDDETDISSSSRCRGVS